MSMIALHSCAPATRPEHRPPAAGPLRRGARGRADAGVTWGSRAMLLCTCDGALAACTLRSGLLRPEATSHGALARWRGAPEPCASPPLGRLGKHCCHENGTRAPGKGRVGTDVTRTVHEQPQRYKRSPDLIVALKTAHDTDLRHLVVSKGSPAVSGSGFLQLETTLKLHVSCAWVFRDLVGPVVDPFAPS